MKKALIIGLLVLTVLISGCTYGPTTTPQPAPGQSPEATAIVTATITATATATPIASGATAAVEIKGFAFNPATLTIGKGTTVTWTNKDSVQHTVTGIGNDISSQILSEGQTFSYTFNQAGTFEYQCHVHPGMRGKVIVT